MIFIIYIKEWECLLSHHLQAIRGTVIELESLFFFIASDKTHSFCFIKLPSYTRQFNFFLPWRWSVLDHLDKELRGKLAYEDIVTDD